MIGLIIYNKFLHTEKFVKHINLFVNAFAERGTSLLPIANADITAILDDGITIAGKMPQKFDFVIFWDKDVKLANCLELCGCKLYNSSNCISLCDDKMLTQVNLAVNGVSVPKAVLVPKTFSNIPFSDFEFLDRAKEELGFPMVIKRSCGSFGAGVFLANNKEEALKIIIQNQDSDLLMQKYIAECKGRDYRLNVVGGKVVAAVERYSATDFRSNATLGGAMRPYEPTLRQRELAVEAAQSVGGAFVGVDILSDGKADYVCEINSNAHFVRVLEVTGINIAEHIADFILEDIG